MSVTTDKVCVGVITKPHGIKGQVCVRSYCENPEDLFGYAPITDKLGASTFKLKLVGTVRGLFIVSINALTNRNDVELLTQTELYISKDQLPQTASSDEFYISDLEGLSVVSEERKSFGVITSVNNYGAGDVIEIAAKDRKSFMLPFSDDAVLSVDMDTKILVISEMAITFITDQEVKL